MADNRALGGPWPGGGWKAGGGEMWTPQVRLKSAGCKDDIKRQLGVTVWSPDDDCHGNTLRL